MVKTKRRPSLPRRGLSRGGLSGRVHRGRHLEAADKHGLDMPRSSDFSTRSRLIGRPKQDCCVWTPSTTARARSREQHSAPAKEMTEPRSTSQSSKRGSGRSALSDFAGCPPGIRGVPGRVASLAKVSSLVIRWKLESRLLCSSSHWDENRLPEGVCKVRASYNSKSVYRPCAPERITISFFARLEAQSSGVSQGVNHERSRPSQSPSRCQPSGRRLWIADAALELTPARSW